MDAWRHGKHVVMGLVLAGLLPVGTGFASSGPNTSLGECTKTTFVRSGEGLVTLSTHNAKVCAVECVATAALGSLAVYDSPTASTTHGQAVVSWEEFAATAGNTSATAGLSLYTSYGLYVDADRCQGIVSWVD